MPQSTPTTSSPTMSNESNDTIAISPPPRPSLPRPPSPDNCAICASPLSANPALSHPCTHAFDLNCLQALQSSASANRCPLCRTPVAEIRYNYTLQGTHSTHLLTEINIQNEIGPSVAPDEEIRAGMSIPERRRAVEVRRVRSRASISSPEYTFNFRTCHVIEDRNLVVVKRGLTFSVRQWGMSTKTTLSRRLEIRTVRLRDEELWRQYQLRLQDSAKVKDAREKIQRLSLALRMDPDGAHFEKLDVKMPDGHVCGNAKGFDVGVGKEIGLARQYSAGLSKPTIVKMQRTTKLHETLPTRVLSSAVTQKIDQLYAGALGRGTRERSVRIARAEMQGLLNMLEQLHANGRILIETATTGILDAEIHYECEYCLQRHRNGDCWFQPGEPFGEWEATRDDIL